MRGPACFTGGGVDLRRSASSVILCGVRIAFRTPWKVDIVSKVGAIAGDALFEIDRFRRTTGCEIKPLTVREILDEEIAAT